MARGLPRLVALVSLVAALVLSASACANGSGRNAVITRLRKELAAREVRSKTICPSNWGREGARNGAALAQERTKRFRAAADGETVAGTFTGIVQLSSGKFAIVEKSHEFTLVPW